MRGWVIIGSYGRWMASHKRYWVIMDSMRGASYNDHKTVPLYPSEVATRFFISSNNHRNQTSAENKLVNPIEERQTFARDNYWQLPTVRTAATRPRLSWLLYCPQLLTPQTVRLPRALPSTEPDVLNRRAARERERPEADISIYRSASHCPAENNKRKLNY